MIVLALEKPIYTQASQWEQVSLRGQNQKNAGLRGGEGMQMIQSIAYAPSNPQVVYMVVDTSQVWKSTDGGKTWEMKHKGFYANGGLSVAVDPLNENVVFVAGSIGYPVERYRPTEPLCGIFRTADGGENWELVKKTFYFKREAGDNGGKYFAFVTNSLDKKRTKIIYAGTYNDGLIKSTDGGDTWTFCGFKDKNIYDIKINPKNPAVVFIATTQGLFKYDNSGVIIKIGEGLPDYPRTIAVNPQNPDILYAACGNNGVYWSTDGGIKFSKRDNGLPIGKEYTHISLSPANPQCLYVSINKSNKLNPFRSHDGGATWYSPNTLDKDKLSLFGDDRFFSGQIEPHPQDINIALAAANGKARVIKTTDGGVNWFYSNEGYTGGRRGGGKTSLAFVGDPKKMVFFLIDHGPVLTIDGGETFQILDVPSLGGRTTPVGAVSDAGLIVTAVGSWKKQILIISRDNGKNWEVIPATEDNYKFIAFHPQKQNIIYAQGFISEDNCNSFRRLTKNIYAICIGNGNIVYTIEADSKNTSMSIIKRSDDRGKTWKKNYPALPVTKNAINELDIDPLNPDRIYVASNSGLFIYDDKAKNWIKNGEESGLTKDYFGLLYIQCVAVDPKHPEVVYVGRRALGKGQSNGIFMSTNYGKTWKNITFNLQEPFNVWSISVSPHDGTIYLGSSHGTWKLIPPYSSGIKVNATFFFIPPAETNETIKKKQ